MRGRSIVLAAWGAVLVCGAARAADDAPAQPDWTGFFPPARAGYAVTFEPPVVAKGDNPVVYRLTAHYDWTGNDFRVGTVAMARDPEFKTKYSVEAMKKEGAKEVTVGKKTGWVRAEKGEGINREAELVVPLSEDKALILTSRGNYGGETELQALAGRFDLAQVEKALAKPPRADPPKEK